MRVTISLLIGYLLGSLSPSALLAKLKDQYLRSQGTKNLGASNTLLIMGKKCGALVMFFDIFKAYFSMKIAKWLFPQSIAAELCAGLAAVIGHVFPFYLRFRGGKGLAAFGGMVLAYDPILFCILLVLCVILMLICNYGVAMPMAAGVLFPILAGLESKSWIVFLLCAAAGLLIIVKHWSNIKRARSGNDIQIRSFIKNGFSTSPRKS
jgi:glycerol-3-phosphate acyltransferase PlsY